MISSGSVGSPGGFQSTGSKVAGMPGALIALSIVPPELQLNPLPSPRARN